MGRAPCEGGRRSVGRPSPARCVPGSSRHALLGPILQASPWGARSLHSQLLEGARHTQQQQRPKGGQAEAATAVLQASGRGDDPPGYSPSAWAFRQQNQLQLHCQGFGPADRPEGLSPDSPTLICSPYWDTCAAPSPQVLTVDARNHGDSPHSPDVSYEAMCQDLQSLLPQLDLAPCALIGHSMGGKTAMLLALQRVSRPCLGLPPSNLDLRCPAGDLGLISLRGPSLGSRNWACSETGPQSNYLPQPELVERLIAVDISPVKTTGTSKFATYVAAMKSIDIPDKMPRSQARKLADKQLSHAVQDMAMRQFLLTNLVEVDGHFQWRVNLDALAEHLDEIMNFPPQQEPYSGPTLFLLGGSSHYVCPSHHPEIRRLFPGARIQTVPNANHWVHADRPQDFMAAVQSFLV
ncbi:alpha/beta hydrolase domain-containing protein 11 [Marmota monax]|uniref:sn-1-specific diacylglycerol lipase ABHD11 n=1 Tax=Marmota monax TaxID=9995 RepID=A0A834QQM8_MARMO|nr:alpha/beta hydrolase domain-containing protein 11 [Marmota monax]